ncbi:MAG: hypothetical protein AB1295_02595 [Candidatus Micrarchaeota archaeon]
MRTILALLMLCVLSAATLDQRYVQVVERDGNTSIEKSADLGLLSVQMNPGAFDRMADICEQSSELHCSVDAENKVVTLTDQFQSGGYYTYESEYGLPFVTHTLTVDSIPTDRFARLMDRLFDNANATGMVSGAGGPLYLSQKEENARGAELLKELGVTITYTVELPSAVSEARAGSVEAVVEGNLATFDLVAVLEDSEPLVVKSSELNFGYIVLVGGVAVLAALAWSFMGSRPKPRKPAKKRKK